MSPVDRPDGWGPSHQTEGRRRWIAKPPVQVAALGAVGMIAGAIHYGATGVAIKLILVIVMLVVIDTLIASAHAHPRAARTPAIPTGQEPLRAVRTLAGRDAEMSPVNRPDGWGPSHQTEGRRRWIAKPRCRSPRLVRCS